MALANPTLVAEGNSSNTLAFAAQTAGKYLVAAVWRNNGLQNTALPTPAGWTEIMQAGPGDPASSGERCAFFGKIADGTETSITFATELAAGTRGITVFSVDPPAGGGGSWKVQTTKVTHSTAVAGLSVLTTADLTHLTDDCVTFAAYQQSSSYALTGNMPAWAGMTVRGSAAVGRGRVANNFSAARNVAVNLDAVGVTDTRRLAGAAFTLAYMKLPTLAFTAPADEADFLTTDTINLTVTATGQNLDTSALTIESSPAGANTFTTRGSDATSPHTYTITAGTLAAGRYDVRAVWSGTGEMGFLQAIQIGGTIQIDVADPPSTGNVEEVYGNVGAGWVPLVAIHENHGSGWVQVWP